MFFYSIKTKLIATVSVLILVLFALGGFLLLKEKTLELSHDIYQNAKSFSELTAGDIVDLSENYLEQDSFLAFNRDIKDIFKKNDDIASIYLVKYTGELLYNSDDEWTQQYSGSSREVTDEASIERIRANNPSYHLETGRTVYIKEDADGNEYFVDANERSVDAITEVDRVVDIVYPIGDYAIIYGVTYDNLQERIDATRARIITLMLIGVVVAFFLSFYMASSIVKPVKALEIGALKIATGDFKYKVPITSKDELGVLSKAFNKMGDDLDASTQALVYKERVAKELELASKIQREILPKNKPAFEGFDIGGGLIAADEVGGDCYDFIETDSGSLYVYLGDVTGHGVAAGLISSVANALLYSATSFSDDPKNILVIANKILAEKTTTNMFMTMVLIKITPEGKLQYISAGHNRMLIYRDKGAKVEELEAGGMALGMVADIEKTLKVNEVEMASGDVLILYSDGIPEAKNDHDEQYDMPRFKRAVSEYCDLVTADGIKNALLADVKEYMGKSVQLDDMTMVVIKKV